MPSDFERYCAKTIAYVQSNTDGWDPADVRHNAFFNVGIDFVTQAGRIADALSSLATSQATLAEIALLNHELAKRYAEFLLSSEGQRLIGAYWVGGKRLFTPAASISIEN